MLASLVDDTPLAAALTLLAGISLATFVISLLLIPLVVARLPGDCFLRLQAPGKPKKPMTAGRVVVVLARNLFGAILLLAGIAMLFLPGQGLLTMLLGILLLSIPGKARLVLFLTASAASRHGLDWLRTKSGKEPFLWPPAALVGQGSGSGENGR